MSRWNVEEKQITVGGQTLVVRALTARERQQITATCKDGQEMEAHAVLRCTTDITTAPAFADLADVLDSPCGHIKALADAILELSGIAVGAAENPT
jgi:hypothetical protein